MPMQRQNCNERCNVVDQILAAAPGAITLGHLPHLRGSVTVFCRDLQTKKPDDPALLDHARLDDSEYQSVVFVERDDTLGRSGGEMYKLFSLSVLPPIVTIEQVN